MRGRGSCIAGEKFKINVKAVPSPDYQAGVLIASRESGGEGLASCRRLWCVCEARRADLPPPRWSCLSKQVGHPVLVDEVRRLEAIIRNVLADVSRGLPTGQPTDLRELRDKVLRLMQPLLETRRIEISSQYFNSVPRVYAAPEQIQLVLTAIINNAMESIPDGKCLSLAIQNG